MRFWKSSITALALLFGLCCAAGCTKRKDIENTNHLALGFRAKVHAPLAVPLIEPIDLSGLSSEQLIATRNQIVEKQKDLLESNYKSWPILFNHVGKDNPWVSISGLQYEGMEKLCGKGVSNESISVLNPLSLVTPHFFGLSLSVAGFEWDQAKVTKEQALSPQFPLYLKMRSLEWNAAESSAKSIYDVGDYLHRVNQYLKSPCGVTQVSFFLSAYNAADFNFRYIFFSGAVSKNINFKTPLSAPTLIRDMIVSRQLASDGPTCNVVSLPQPEMDEISLTNLPAELPIRLWKSKPKSGDDAPDMTFILSFK